MRPDDPRHGTNAGYLAGCGEQCCKAAHAAYKHELRDHRRMAGVERLYVDAKPTARRIEALLSNGWRHTDIDRLLGYEARGASSTWSHNVLRQKRVHVAKHRAILRLYDHLRDTPGPSDNQWWRVRVHRWYSIDPVVVERILAGGQVEANNAERYEAMRRWLKLGRSAKSLSEQMGWKSGRYMPTPEDGAA